MAQKNNAKEREILEKLLGALASTISVYKKDKKLTTERNLPLLKNLLTELFANKLFLFLQGDDDDLIPNLLALKAKVNVALISSDLPFNQEGKAEEIYELIIEIQNALKPMLEVDSKM